MVKHTSPQRPRSKNVKIACQQITAFILDYLTRELDAETALAFKAHLRECPDCIAFLSTYQKTVHAAQSLRYESIPLQMRKRVRQFLREKIKVPPP